MVVLCYKNYIMRSWTIWKAEAEVDIACTSLFVSFEFSNSIQQSLTMYRPFCFPVLLCLSLLITNIDLFWEFFFNLRIVYYIMIFYIWHGNVWNRREKEKFHYRKNKTSWIIFEFCWCSFYYSFKLDKMKFEAFE